MHAQLPSASPELPMFEQLWDRCKMQLLTRITSTSIKTTHWPRLFQLEHYIPAVSDNQWLGAATPQHDNSAALCNGTLPAFEGSSCLHQKRSRCDSSPDY
eukprot:GHRR01024728.1.p2 GENE.GHRR01024728.1~~GHRR01024728.1.p2  ORF type:complete len:100 (+),score=18.72 GHRR01024728.1:627-926(+)